MTGSILPALRGVYLNQALRICLEWSLGAIYFSTHQFELIHKILLKTNRIHSLLTKSIRIFFLEYIFLLLLILVFWPFKKFSF